MTDSYSNKSVVLLLGEGNFSYAASYLKRLINQKINQHVIATDFKIQLKNEQIDFFTKRNISLIQKYGGETYLDVDATSLESHPKISQLLENGIHFSEIIFNFPFSDDNKAFFGSETLENTRKLLREFFMSVAKICTEKTKILVSLTAGQSGIYSDSLHRGFSNSFMINAMAAYGSFSLIEIQPFEFIGNYVPGGYLNMDHKSFPFQDSYTYIFAKREDDSFENYLNNNIRINTIQNLLSQNNENNILKNLSEQLAGYFSNFNFKFNQIWDFNNDDQFNYNQVFYPMYHQIEITNFDINHVKMVITMLSQRSCKVDSNNLFVDDFKIGFITSSGKLYLNLDILTMLINNISDPRKLWSFSRIIPDTIEDNAFSSSNLCPPEYRHHLDIKYSNFCSEKDFLAAVFDVLGFYIKYIFFDDSFLHSKTLSTSKCYKIYYQSLYHPLSKSDSSKLQSYLNTELANRLKLESISSSVSLKSWK